MLPLRRAPRTLECVPSEYQRLLGVGPEDSDWTGATVGGALHKDIEILTLLFAALSCKAGT